MSGIFLVVWDEHERDNSMVLRATRGGWPHITLVYTGEKLSKEQLKAIVVDLVVSTELLGQQIILTGAYVNSFEDKPDHTRHDVLLKLSVDNESMIEKLRTQFVREKFDNAQDFSMHDPHVTHAIFETREDAQAQADLVNQMLPYEVRLTGITIG